VPQPQPLAGAERVGAHAARLQALDVGAALPDDEPEGFVGHGDDLREPGAADARQERGHGLGDARRRHARAADAHQL